MLGEMTDETNRGRAFSYWEASYGIGTIVGPMLGGMLVDPAKQYPYWFNTPFFVRFPYFLPCFMSSIVSVIGAILGMIYMDESLKSKRKREQRDSTSTVVDEEVGEADAIFVRTTSQSSIESVVLTIKEILNGHVLMSILCYATWCLITIIYEEVYALFVAEPLSHGGLAFNSFEIGLALSLTGFVQVFVQLFIFPYLERTIGIVRVFRWAAILMAIFSLLLPFISDFARYLIGDQGEYSPAQKQTVFWLLFALLSGKTLASVIGTLN